MSNDVEDALEGHSPLSHKVNVATLPQKGVHVVLKPDSEALAEFAVQNDLLSIDGFDAELHLARWHKDGIKVAGKVSATVGQSCVVTLEPLENRIEADIEAIYVPEESKLARRRGAGEGAEIFVDPEGPDAPETFRPPWLDVGAIAEEFLLLEIDPWPRKEGAQAPNDAGTADDAAQDDERPNPFAALSALKDKL